MNRYFEIISGKDRDWSADLARLALHAASVPYGMVTEARNWGFERGWLPVRSVPVPVLSIGNLTTGGTGKTPTVAWLVNWLRELGERPAIVSRGYGAIENGENDEKRLLDALCPGVPHIQNPRRIEAAREALRSTSSNIIVLDDGFQHRQLHRDLDFVLIDALNPWGFDALLPRGLLRERLHRLQRADVVFITRCELAAAIPLAAIQRRLQSFTSAPILRTAFEPLQLINSLGETLPLTAMRREDVFAFCGIGNPNGFRRTLEMLLNAASPDPDAKPEDDADFAINRSGTRPYPSLLSDERFMTFPDHFHYLAGDLKRIARRAAAQSAGMLVTTRKDLVKLQTDRIADVPLWSLDIGLKFLDNPAFLAGLLRTLLARESPPVTSAHQAIITED